MAKGIEEPYSVDHKAGNAHVLYLRRRYRDDPEGNQMAVFIYAAPYAAKWALNLLLEDDGIEWIHENRLMSESGIEIEVRPCRTTTHSLTDLYNHEFSIAELAFEMQPPYSTECKRFRYGRQPDALGPRPDKKVRGLTRKSRAGMIPLAEIALSMGTTAKECRNAFRKAKIKPAQGYAWPHGEVDEVKTKIKELLGL